MSCEGPALGRRWVLFFTQPPFSFRSAFACKLESNELWLSLYIISALPLSFSLSLCPVRRNEYEWCNNVWLKPRGTHCQDSMSSSHPPTCWWGIKGWERAYGWSLSLLLFILYLSSPAGLIIIQYHISRSLHGQHLCVSSSHLPVRSLSLYTSTSVIHYFIKSEFKPSAIQNHYEIRFIQHFCEEPLKLEHNNPLTLQFILKWSASDNVSTWAASRIIFTNSKQIMHNFWFQVFLSESWVNIVKNKC